MKSKTSALDRLIQGATAQGQVLGGQDADAMTSWPELWRWMTSTDAGPDHLKEPAKLSLRATTTGFLASLSDESFGVSIEAASPSLSGVFAAIEAALTQETPALRTWPRHKIALKKRPKQKET